MIPRKRWRPCTSRPRTRRCTSGTPPNGGAGTETLVGMRLGVSNTATGRHGPGGLARVPPATGCGVEEGLVLGERWDCGGLGDTPPPRWRSKRLGPPIPSRTRRRPKDRAGDRRGGRGCPRGQVRGCGRSGRRRLGTASPCSDSTSAPENPLGAERRRAAAAAVREQGSREPCGQQQQQQ